MSDPSNTPPADPDQRRLDRLRHWRNWRDPDLSLGFLQKAFKRDVERPYKQLGELAQLWEQLLPRELATHTRLDSFSRGVLRVTVDSSPRLYELDRLLRAGLQRQLVQHQTGTKLQRVRLHVGNLA